MDSPAGTPRRSRHAKSQSTSALSTILDGPSFRGETPPPVPAVPTYLRAKRTVDPDLLHEQNERSSNQLDGSLAGRQSHLPGITVLSQSPSFVNTNDTLSTSTPSRGLSRSKTHQSIVDPGSPTPKRAATRRIDDGKDRSSPLPSRSNGAERISSPSKRRVREVRQEKLGGSGSRGESSQDDSSFDRDARDVRRFRNVSGSSSMGVDDLAIDLQEWSRTVSIQP
jgi:hypothetical protein